MCCSAEEASGALLQLVSSSRRRRQCNSQMLLEGVDFIATCRWIQHLRKVHPRSIFTSSLSLNISLTRTLRCSFIGDGLSHVLPKVGAIAVTSGQMSYIPVLFS
jgi:hypothetical protein